MSTNLARLWPGVGLHLVIGSRSDIWQDIATSLRGTLACHVYAIKNWTIAAR